ncbi:hypothetical protein ACFQ3Z_15205 [Streptomyces nogalater]
MAGVPVAEVSVVGVVSERCAARAGAPGAVGQVSRPGVSVVVASRREAPPGAGAPRPFSGIRSSSEIASRSAR